MPLDYAVPNGGHASIAMVKLTSSLKSDDGRHPDPILFNPGCFQSICLFDYLLNLAFGVRRTWNIRRKFLAYEWRAYTEDRW